MTWTRAPMLTLCGYCNAEIAKGSPVRMVRIGPRLRPRCPVCAGEPVPADLPELAARVPITPTVKASRGPLFASVSTFAPVGKLARDWKEKQSGRDPGEDDAA